MAAERLQQQQQQNQNGVSGRLMIYAAVAGVAVAAPLLGMMGFTFLATLTLLLVTSPLLLLFSPLLLFVGFVFMVALAGFAIAATMAFAGVSTLAWMYKEIRGSFGFGFGSKRGELVPAVPGISYLQQQQKGQEKLVT